MKKKNYCDLTGKKFNNLTVIKRVGTSKNRNPIWLCKCDCGNYTKVQSNHLKEGHTKSCGCLQKINVSISCVKDLTGKKFGKLTVIKRSLDKICQRAAVWKCKCECGNIAYVRTANLISGHTKSCGCLHFEVVWKGGKSVEPYCEAWGDKEYKADIRERDGNRCLNPDCWGTDNVLSIHHIDYNKKNCHPNNLITVCRSCNTRANTNRTWHTSWYQAIMYKRYQYTY